MCAVAAWAHEQFACPPDQALADLWGLFMSGVRGDTFDRWLASRGLDPARWVPVMVDTYRRHEPRIRPYPETVALLDRLQVRHALGLVTDGRREVQERKLNALGLRRYFQAVVFSDGLGREARKPSGRPFEAVLEQLSVAGRSAVYVADNTAKDFRGARCVGMGTIRLRHPRGLYALLEPETPADAPDWEIERLDQLEEVLAGAATLQR